MNKSFQELANRLDSIYRGEPWFGESIQMKLKDVTEPHAFQQPKPGRHSVAEILTHMQYWRTIFLNRIKGDKSVTSGPDWPDVYTLKQAGWKDIRVSFEAAHEALIQALRSCDSSDESLVADLHGLVEHDIYHLGQIGIVKRIVD